MKRAIKNHAFDFGAILGLLLLSVIVAGYILSKERFQFPFLSPSNYTINADFSTAQAVTPGQGQSVRVSGVQIGEIAGVTLKNGTAEVSMQIQSKYKQMIHQDATALLRPKTGLKDMFVEITPGSAATPVLKSGGTIPVSNTNPDVSADEILGALDGDTRAYLQLLVNGAGQGLKGKGGSELAQVFQRFEPTHRDLARLNGAVAVRGRDLQQLVDSLRRLNVALGTKQTQIVSLVDSSAKVFRAFASEDRNISQAIRLLPGTLQQTTATLQKVQTFARLLGPTSTSLLPAAASIPAANSALTSLARPSAPIIQSQIRPFVIAARPTVRQLKPASINLANATPNLSSAFAELNHLVNMLGYYPTGQDQHGYLWWLAWLDHSARTLFSIQDANGVFRPLFLQASCASLNQIASNLAGSALLLNLEPIIGPTGICNTQTGSSGGGGLIPTLPLPLPLAKHANRSGAQGRSNPGAGSGSTAGSSANSSPSSSSASNSSSSSTTSNSSANPNAAPASATPSSSSSSTLTSVLPSLPTKP